MPFTGEVRGPRLQTSRWGGVFLCFSYFLTPPCWQGGLLLCPNYLSDFRYYLDHAAKYLLLNCWFSLGKIWCKFNWYSNLRRSAPVASILTLRYSCRLSIKQMYRLCVFTLYSCSPRYQCVSRSFCIKIGLDFSMLSRRSENIKWILQYSGCSFLETWQ